MWKPFQFSMLRILVAVALFFLAFYFAHLQGSSWPHPGIRDYAEFAIAATSLGAGVALLFRQPMLGLAIAVAAMGSPVVLLIYVGWSAHRSFHS